MKSLNRELAYAYAIGYHDGREHGSEINILWFTLDNEKQAYNEGYESGVSDYCHFELNERDE